MNEKIASRRILSKSKLSCMYSFISYLYIYICKCVGMAHKTGRGCSCEPLPFMVKVVSGLSIRSSSHVFLIIADYFLLP